MTPIGVAIRVIIRRTDRRKETREQSLRSCIEINPRRLRRIIHRDIGPAEPETKLTARWALCRSLSLSLIFSLCRCLCPSEQRAGMQ